MAISGPGATSHLITMLAYQHLNFDPVQAKVTLLTIPGPEMTRHLAMESGRRRLAELGITNGVEEAVAALAALARRP